LEILYSLEEFDFKTAIARFLDSGIDSKITSHKAKTLLQKKAAIEIANILIGKSCEVGYTQKGKPFITNSDIKISFSHTENLIASIINYKEETGLDIQKLSPKILTIANKFLSKNEKEFAKDIESMHIIWSAKEALYKVYGEKELIFKEDLIIEPFKLSKKGILTGEINKGKVNKKYLIQYELLWDDIFLVFVRNEIE
jgi:phosphopantetheinyl transferase